MSALVPVSSLPPSLSSIERPLLVLHYSGLVLVPVSQSVMGPGETNSKSEQSQVLSLVMLVLNNWIIAFPHKFCQHNMMHKRPTPASDWIISNNVGSSENTECSGPSL